MTKEITKNWWAVAVLVIFATIIGVLWATAKNPYGFSLWLLLDVTVLTSAFIIKWAIVRLWNARKKPLPEETQPQTCAAYIEYGLGCQLPAGHEGAHYANRVSPAEPALQNK
jgi:hypothetical protein